ncbi:MAG: cell wall hydrolase [Clostridia bacterium]|nr:cell wall hydrolase [Clostridia bacterium]
MKKKIAIILLFILIFSFFFSSAAPGTSSNNNQELLARIVHAEAKGEPYLGQVAVAAVILNRVDSSDFPNTLAGVIYQPGAFEPVMNGTINQAVPQDATARKAAKEALNGYDPTGGCLYFYNPSTAKSKWIWSKTIVKQIGKHNFAK